MNYNIISSKIDQGKRYNCIAYITILFNHVSIFLPFLSSESIKQVVLTLTATNGLDATVKLDRLFVVNYYCAYIIYSANIIYLRPGVEGRPVPYLC